MPLELDERVKNATQAIFDALVPGVIRTTDVLPGEDREKAQKRLKELVAEAIASHLEAAYSAGDSDAKARAKPKK
jgi:hypothetical protein